MTQQQRERIQTMLHQALVDAHSRGTNQITELHLVLHDTSQEKERGLRKMLYELTLNTPAENAQVIVRSAPSRFICWNCCGLRFESYSAEGICLNCGHEGVLISDDTPCVLDHIDAA